MDFCKCFWSAIRRHAGAFFRWRSLQPAGVRWPWPSPPLQLQVLPSITRLCSSAFRSEWETRACPVDYFTEMQSVLGFWLTPVTAGLNRYRCQRWTSGLLSMQKVWLTFSALPEVKRNHMLGVFIPWLIFDSWSLYSVKQVNVNDLRGRLEDCIWKDEVVGCVYIVCMFRFNEIPCMFKKHLVRRSSCSRMILFRQDSSFSSLKRGVRTGTGQLSSRTLWSLTAHRHPTQMLSDALFNSLERIRVNNESGLMNVDWNQRVMLQVPSASAALIKVFLCMQCNLLKITALHN